MSLLWIRTVAAWEDASPEARDRRVRRVKQWIDRQSPRGYGNVEISDQHAQFAAPRETSDLVHSTPWFSQGHMLGNVHSHHLPWKELPLDSTFHTTQGTFRPEVLHHKIDFAHQYSDQDDDYPEHDDQFDEHDPTQDPIAIHKGGHHYLLDGHHRFMEHRLLGKPTMHARVFDADDPQAGPEHCYDCQEHKEYCSDCGGDPDGDESLS